MISRQEIIDSLNGENKGPAPPAVFTQSATFEDMEVSGFAFPDANFEKNAMKGLALQMNELHGFATARVPFCITVETERLGGNIKDGGKTSQPATLGSIYSSKDEISEPVPEVPELMDPQDLVEGGRCLMVREILQEFRKERPDLFTTAVTLDPMGLAAALVGYENFMMGFFMDPDANDAWVRAMVPYSCAYTHSLSLVADNVMTIVAGDASLCPSEHFEKWVEAPARKVFSGVECFSMCHSCGDTLTVRGKLAGLGETMLSVESGSDPESLYNELHGKVRLVGGIDPLRTLLQGDPSAVRKKATEFSELGYDVIIPECGVPPMTKGTNLDALATYRETVC